MICAVPIPMSSVAASISTLADHFQYWPLSAWLPVLSYNM